jgi:hypothetical protein
MFGIGKDVRILLPTSLPHERLGPLALHEFISHLPMMDQSKAALLPRWLERSSDVRIIKEIMLVPFPRAASSRLMSFFTFQISMFFSASLALGSLMVNDGYKMTDVRREKNTKVDVALTPPLEGKFGFLLLFGSVRL